MGIRKHITYANVAATLGLVLGLSGSAYAIVVTSGDIKDGTIRSIDVGNDQLTGTDLNDGSVGLRDLGINVNSAGIALSDVVSSSSSPTSLASVPMTLKKPGDVFGTLTLQTANPATAGTLMNVVPYVDGAQDGHVYTFRADTITTVTATFFYDSIPAGAHEFSVVGVNGKEDITIEDLDWTVVSLP